MITEFLTIQEYTKMQIQANKKIAIERTVEVEPQEAFKEKEVVAHVKEYKPERINPQPLDPYLRDLIRRNYKYRVDNIDIDTNTTFHVPKKRHTKYFYTKKKWNSSIYNPEHTKTVVN